MVKKKLGLTTLFFTSSEASLSTSSVSAATSFSTAASWQWPSCTQARTTSFRCDSPEIVSTRHQSHSMEDEADGFKFKTSMNPAYMLDEQQSCSLSSDSSENLCTAPEAAAAAAAVDDKDEDEAIVRSLRSNGRLFFEPESTSSIVKMKKASGSAKAFDGATALAMDSADPYDDFRRSMEEMVLSHGINDWGWLEEMLGWYLSANGKKTHGLIVGAFVDLLVALTSSSPSPACCCSSAAKKGKRQTTEDQAE